MRQNPQRTSRPGSRPSGFEMGRDQLLRDYLREFSEAANPGMPTKANGVRSQSLNTGVSEVKGAALRRAPVGKRYVIVAGVSRYDPEHDKYDANFVDAAAWRIRNLRARFPKDEIVILYYGRPGRDRREILDEFGPRPNPAMKMAMAAKAYHADLRLVDNAEDITAHLNATGRATIKQIDYFGHSSAQRWLLNYSESPTIPGSLPGASDSLGVEHFGRIRHDRLAPTMKLYSWGCNQADDAGKDGPSFCQEFTRYFQRPSRGSVGRTDFKKMSLFSPQSKVGYRVFKPG